MSLKPEQSFQNLKSEECWTTPSLSEQHLLVCVGYDFDQRFVKIYDVEHILSVSAQVQSTSWMPHQQYVMQPTVSTPASYVQRLPFKSH